MSTASAMGQTNSHGDSLVRWVVACIKALQNSRWHRALNYRGADVADLCFEEVFLAAQRAVRGETIRLLRPPVVRTLLGLRARSLRQVLIEIGAHWWSARPGTTNGLFLPIEPTHVQQHLPVARSAERQGMSIRFATSRPVVVDRLRREGFNALLLQAAWPARLASARQAGLAAARSLLEEPGVSLPRFSEQLSAPDAVRALREPLIRMLPFAYEAVRAAELVIDEMCPDLIMVGNDLTVGGRALCRVAARLGVKTACLMHGTVMDGLHAQHIADRLFVYGDAQRRYLTGHHQIAADRVEICGAPYLDQMRAQSGVVHPALRSRLGLTEGQPLVVLAISNPANLVSEVQHRHTIDAVTRLTTQIPEAVFVAKLHRGDSPEHYAAIRRQVPGARLHVVAHQTPGWPADIVDWLQGCSLLLTGASTAAIEAMLLDVPVVSMDFTGDYAGVDFIANGATVHITDANALESTVRGIVVDHKRVASADRAAATFLDDYFHRRDGKSSERCAQGLAAVARRESTRCVASPA